MFSFPVEKLRQPKVVEGGMSGLKEAVRERLPGEGGQPCGEGRWESAGRFQMGWPPSPTSPPPSSEAALPPLTLTPRGRGPPLDGVSQEWKTLL